MEEVSSLEVGSPGKISLSEKVLLVASRRRGMYRQGGFGGLAIKVGAVKAGIVEMDSKSCYQGGYGWVLEADQRRFNLVSGRSSGNKL